MALNHKKVSRVSQSAILKFVKSYRASLVAQKIVVEKLILYGSYARDEQTEHSDSDLCVVIPKTTKDFAGVSSKIKVMAARTGRDMDVFVVDGTRFKSD